MQYSFIKIGTPFVPTNFLLALRRFFENHKEECVISMEVTGKKQITILPKCKIDLSNKKHVRFLIDHVINKIRENTPLEGCFLLIVMHNPGEIPPPFKDVYYPFNK